VRPSLLVLPVKRYAMYICDGCGDIESFWLFAAILKKLSWIDRYLYIWILLTMAAGILIGEFVHPVPRALNRVEIVTVSLPITLGLWLMMWPVLTKVQYDLLWTLLKDSKARTCQIHLH
jgi:arsenite transporter